MNINYNSIKLITLFIIGSLLIVGCNTSNSQPIIDPTELLIDLSSMPANWYVTSQGDEPAEYFRQQDGARIQFWVNNPEVHHVAAHTVYRFKNERQAAGRFERLLVSHFNSNSIASHTPWQPPQELPYTSAVADQFYFACHEGSINGIKTVCQAIGQYGNYLIMFNTHVTSEYMTYSDIETILQTIDNRMTTYLESD